MNNETCNKPEHPELHIFLYFFGNHLKYGHTITGEENIKEWHEKSYIKPSITCHNPTYEDLPTTGTLATFTFDYYPDKLIVRAQSDGKYLDGVYFENGYKIKYNSYWKMWQLSHPDIAAHLGDYNELGEALVDAQKG
ncbi:MAG: hypothetical protein JKY60_19620 [Kordiimonadaceae bacterium]|nr:hypothetical protein [Kordiimonadaceae bacterium]